MELSEHILEELFSIMDKYPRGTSSANLAKEYEQLLVERSETGRGTALPDGWVDALDHAAEFEVQQASSRLTLVFKCDKQVRFHEQPQTLNDTSMQSCSSVAGSEASSSSSTPAMDDVIDARMSQGQMRYTDMARSLKYPQFQPGTMERVFVVALQSGSLFVQTLATRDKYRQLQQDLADNYGQGDQSGCDITDKVLSTEHIHRHGLYAALRRRKPEPQWGRAIVLASSEPGNEPPVYQCFFPDDGGIEPIGLAGLRRLIPDALDYDVCAYHCKLQSADDPAALQQKVFALDHKTKTYTIPKLNIIQVESTLLEGNDSVTHLITLLKDNTKVPAKVIRQADKLKPEPPSKVTNGLGQQKTAGGSDHQSLLQHTQPDHNGNVLKPVKAAGGSGDAFNSNGVPQPQLAKRPLPAQLPAVVDAFVVSAPDPSCFVIRLQDDEILASILAGYMQHAKPLPEDEPMEAGQLYSARVPSGWERAYLSKLLPAPAASSTPLVRLFLVDIGEYAVVPRHSVRRLPQETHVAGHMLAIKCALADIQPAADSTSHDGFWSANAQAQFSNLVLGKMWKVEMLTHMADWMMAGAPALPFVSVRLLRPDNNQSVAQHMIHMKLARQTT